MKSDKKCDEIRGDLERSCVLTYKPDKCDDGYFLFSNYRGNIFYLIDRKGRVVHTWRTRTAKIGELLPNGHLMYGHMWNGMAEVDWKSNEVWYYDCSQHHDFEIMENGNVMILCGDRGQRFDCGAHWEKRLDPHVREEGVFGTAYFIEVDPNSNEKLWEWWADDHLEELERIAGVEFPRDRLDVFHANTCEVLPETELGRKDSRFKVGNIVFSYRNTNTIGVIDRRNGEIVWAWGPGTLDRQHMPTLIPNEHRLTKKSMPGAGHFLIFDNGPNRGYSRVLELDPLEEKIVWKYEGENFFGSWGAGQERLPNGNTVICEGGPHGRLLEVTREGEVVWEYLTPYFDGMGEHAIYRCVKYPSDYVEKIMEEKGTPKGFSRLDSRPTSIRPSFRKTITEE